MEKRFGIKDLFLFLMIGTLIVLVILAMVQFDRQYDQVLNLKTQNDQMATEVSRIKRQIGDLAAGGLTISKGSAAASSQPANDVFARLQAAEQLPGFARGGWFIDNFATKIGRLTPLVSQDVYATWVQGQVLEGFFDRDPYTLEWVPRIARSWEISNNGLTIRFKMRDDVTFSDGHPLTADDIIFTYDWIRNPEVNAPRSRAYLTTLKDVKKIDDFTVEFTFSDQYYLNFEITGYGIMPKHFYSKYTPNQFNEHVGLLMGSGPYMIENPSGWSPGNGVTLVRNPRYWGVRPTFDRIIFNEIQEEAAEQVRYGNQGHDLIRCTPEVFEKLLKDQRIMAFSNSYRVRSPYKGYSYIGWNQKRKVDGQDKDTLFSDKRARQAMTMMIDRERMAKEIFLGYATVASGPFAPDGPQSDPGTKPWPYDAARAKQLLAELGFEDRNGDGVIEDREGRPFRFKLSYPGGAEIYEKIILFLRDNFARGGVIMEPERLDWPVLVNKLTQSDFEAVIIGWSGSIESDPYQVFHSSQIAGQGDNRTSYINSELDGVIDKARKTMETSERMKLWNRVHQILHEDQPYTFMLNRDELRLFNKRVHNIEDSRVGQNFEYLNGGVIPWFIPKEQQRLTQ